MNLVQSLVTGVEIGNDKAVITYNPNLARESDTVDVEKKSVRMKQDWLPEQHSETTVF